MNMKRPYTLGKWARTAVPVALACAAAGNISTEAASYRDTILADNPVAYYRLEEAVGEVTAVDSSSSGAFPGIYYSSDGVFPILEQAGIDVNSVYFRTYKDEGGTLLYSYVEVPYAAELNPQGPFTAEAWVRSMSLPPEGEYRSPVGNFGGWVTDSPGWFFYQTPQSVGSSSAWVWVMKGGGIWIQSGPVTKYEWYHLAAAYDGSAVSFYVNGQLIGTSAVPGYVASTTTSTYIGAGPQGAWPFDGQIDEVAIYGGVLTVDQIRNHYEVGLVHFRVENVAPKITQEPAAATAYAGQSATFSVGADGTAPLSYQWYKNDVSIPGATTDTLTFEATVADNGASFKAVVTNPYGAATSASVTLTVSTDLVVTSQPASITRNVGSAAAFRVVATGALPLSYQWYKGTEAIAGATGSTLWLVNLQAGEDGSTYHASVTNPWGGKDSDEATLTVAARTTEVPITGYAKVVTADGPVGYWRLNEPEGSTVAIDAVGSFDGSFEAGSGAFGFAAPTGVPGETDAALSVTGGARVKVPYALELNPHGPFTAEAWLKPATLGADSQDYRTVFSSEGSGPTGWLLYQQPNHTWAWVIFADNWVSSWLVDAVDAIAADTWYHVALVSTGSEFFLYVNGQLRASQTWEVFIPNRDGTADFGWRSDNDWKPFDGALDEIAFYNKALTQEQVEAHSKASVRISVEKSGNDMVLRWPFGILQQADTVSGTYADLTGVTPPHTLRADASAKFYRVKLP